MDAPVGPADHGRRRLLPAVDVPTVLPVRATADRPDQGRRPRTPVLRLKLAVVVRQDNRADRAVRAGARCPSADRRCGGRRLQSPWPHPTGLTDFRHRVGPERMPAIVATVVGPARRLGWVHERRRLQEATPLIAPSAIPSTRRLVAAVRDQLLDALQPVAPARCLLAGVEPRFIPRLLVTNPGSTPARRLLKKCPMGTIGCGESSSVAPPTVASDHFFSSLARGVGASRVCRRSFYRRSGCCS